MCFWVLLQQCDSCHMGWGSYVIVPAGCCFSHYSTDILKCAADAVSCLLFLGDVYVQEKTWN
jgi:hypothetical protein